MIKKVLIANRGEIALRVIRACKELGIKTVTVHSEGDKLSLHRRSGDEDICIGESSPADSYLNIPRIIAAALITGADAIHPGYGFLAENPKFSEICKKNHIKFIGPSKEMIEMMGDKVTARGIAMKTGIPVTPGSEGTITDIKKLKDTAKKIGYPVILKATAGGGGKGMRIVRNEREIEENFLIAQNEARIAFSNPDVYVEKYIERPRHIEVQILSDAYGNVIHLGERECSIQRKHQKLIEESPSPAVDNNLRNKMTTAAVNLVKYIKYEGAGTIEFLLDKNKNFYFMEMNTRIQVEHTISEERTKIDLVKEQITVASGEKLRFKQNDIKFIGHSFECRINAEDPYTDFTPSPGKIDILHFPGGLGVRVDSHIYSGYEIPPYYDSLLGKLVIWAADRDIAIKRVLRSLDEMVIEGVSTTIPFYKQIFKDKNFIRGNFDTHFLDNFKLK